MIITIFLEFILLITQVLFLFVNILPQQAKDALTMFSTFAFDVVNQLYYIIHAIVPHTYAVIQGYAQTFLTVIIISFLWNSLISMFRFLTPFFAGAKFGGTPTN